MGVLWVRMPLPFQLNHINLWLLEDGNGWALIDTGINTPEPGDYGSSYCPAPRATRSLRMHIRITWDWRVGLKVTLTWIDDHRARMAPRTFSQRGREGMALKCPAI